jgi:tRNA pseudouridine55 synthase
VARLDLVGTPDADTAVLEMVCGPGGYVRAIARDLGAALGCLGHALWLRRLAAGPFDLEGAVDPAALEPGAEGLDALLRPVAAGLAGVPEVAVGAAEAAALARGGAIPAAGRAAEGARVWASADGRPVALCAVAGGALRPERVFVFD